MTFEEWYKNWPAPARSTNKEDMNEAWDASRTQALSSLPAQGGQQHGGYTDPKSRVYFDGRERLVGKDWTRRKREVWERGGGRCERIVNYVGSMDMPVRCRSEMHDPHHIVKRSKKRDDRLEALIGLCRLHHELLDERKPRWGQASQLRNKRLLGIA